MPFTRTLIALDVRYRIARSRIARKRLGGRIGDETGAVAIEYVIVAIALLAIAGAIAAALTTLGNDAVEQIPDSVSGG